MKPQDNKADFDTLLAEAVAAIEPPRLAKDALSRIIARREAGERKELKDLGAT